MNTKQKNEQNGKNRDLTDLIHGVARLDAQLVMAGDRLMRGYGLSSARWKVMGAIRGAVQPITVARIARSIGLKRQGVQRISNELACEGYVRLIENPDHKRAKLVEMTPAGIAAFGAVMAQYNIWAENIEKALPAGSLSEMLGFVSNMRRVLEDTEGQRKKVEDAGQAPDKAAIPVKMPEPTPSEPVRLPNIAPWP